MGVKFYNRYNPKPLEKGTDFTGMEEVANQQMAEEVNLSKIIENYNSGVISDLPVVRQAQYNDVMITPTSYAEAKNMVDSVKSDYLSLPKNLQRQFGSLDNYISEISKIACGDTETLAKYSNFELNSPAMTGGTSAVEGSLSSSLSRDDSEIGSTDVKPTNNSGFAEKGE